MGDALSSWRLREHQAARRDLEAAVLRCLFERDDWVLGEEVAAFERELSAYLGSAHGVGVSSGTDALILALLAVGVGPGDEVVLPAFTYVATGLAVLHAGARPVFADVETERWTLDPDAVESLITDRTRAILPVHPFGRAAAMPDLLAIARRHQLAVIEDAAQGIGAEVDGQRVGTWGDAGCFSFFPSKNLAACGDGGFVATPSAATAEAVRLLRTPGSTEPEEHVRLRANRRLDTIQAAILRVKLRRLDSATRRRRELLSRMLDRLGSLELAVGNRPDDAPTELVLIAPRRADLRRRLKQRGFRSRVHWPAILPDLPVFEQPAGHGRWPVSRFAANSLLGVPIHPAMTDAEADAIADLIARSYSV